MIALPVPPQMLAPFVAMVLLTFAAFVVAYMGAVTYRWKRERQDEQRTSRLAELHAFAESLRRQKGEGIDA